MKYTFLAFIAFLFIAYLSSAQYTDETLNPSIPYQAQVASNPYTPPTYPTPGWNLVLSEFPTHLQALTIHTFTLSLTGLPGWIGGSLVITDIRGLPVIWTVQIPTNHTAFITVYTGMTDFNINLSVLFPHQGRFTRDFWVEVH